MIPKQLHQSDFRFCLLKSKDKIPFEKEWQKKGYKFDDPKLISWIKVGGNYGVIGGYGNLIILDKDDEKLGIDLDTFTVETGSGGKHYYLLSDYKENHVFIDDLGELRSKNYQVVGSGCIHPNGNKYKVHRDKDILKISPKELKKIIKPFLRKEISSSTTLKKYEGKDTTRSGLEYRRVLSMIRKGKSKEQIFQDMDAYSKWKDGHEAYKETTYQNALEYLARHKKEEKEEKVEKIDEIYTDPELMKGRLKILYGEIKKILQKYMDLKEDDYTLITFWIIGTWFHNNLSSYPYLYFNAMKGSGKTRLLNLVKTFSRDGEMLASMTEAVLFRTTGTLCIDEFEGVSRKGNESLRELLNASYKKGIKVKRMRKAKGKDGEEQVVETFEVYRPIAMANIWGMENVLADRCIPIILEKSNDDTITKLQEDFDENKIIKNIVSQIPPKIPLKSDTCDTDTMMLENTKQKWNDYITEQKVSKSHSVNSVNSGSSRDNIYNNLFKKIDDTNILGRDLELFFPIFLISNLMDKVDIVIEIAQKVIRDRKESDREENWDVQLIDFISQHPSNDFIAVTDLTNKFKEFSGISSDMMNNTWMGRALRRLALVKDKRRTGRYRTVKLNIEKAQEKIRMFK